MLTSFFFSFLHIRHMQAYDWEPMIVSVSQPVPQNVAPLRGKDVTLNCDVGELIIWKDPFGNIITNSAPNSTTLTISGVGRSIAGRYECTTLTTPPMQYTAEMIVLGKHDIAVVFVTWHPCRGGVACWNFVCTQTTYIIMRAHGRVRTYVRTISRQMPDHCSYSSCKAVFLRWCFLKCVFSYGTRYCCTTVHKVQAVWQLSCIRAVRLCTAMAP